MLSIKELTDKYRDGSLTPLEYTKQQLIKLKRVNQHVNAVAFFVDENKILKAAQESTNRYKLNQPLSIFDGIIITTKDINSSHCRDIPLTNGSAIPEALQIPTDTAAHIDLILKGGAILICTTTTPEIGFKSTTNSIKYGVTKNSRNLSLTSGGSSGGAATLCAAGVAQLNFGSDGGGSIRIPSACCGVIGLKTSFGIGFVGDFPFLSTVGPLVRYMDDLRLYMQHICNNDNNHLWNLRVHKSIFNTMDFSADYILNSDINSIKIAVSKTLDILPEMYINNKVWKHILNAVNILKQNDITNITFASPNLSDIRKRYFFIMANIWRAGMNNGYSPYVNKSNEHLIDPVLLKIIQKGNIMNSDRLFQSLIDRDQVKKSIYNFFNNDGYDILITPTLPILPPKAYDCFEEAKHKEITQGLMGQYTGMFNLTHNPSISINCGYENNNIPIGLQITGKMYSDDLIMKFANFLQNKCGPITVAKL